MRTTDTSMKPEDRRALQNLLVGLEGKIQMDEMSSRVWIENNLSFFRLPFATKRIPSGVEWRWNQSRAKKEIFLQQHNAKVVIAKLIARKTKPTDTAPNYKLWQFTVTFQSSKEEEPLVVLWCEKGRSSSESASASLDSLFCNPEPSKLYAAQISFICN